MRQLLALVLIALNIGAPAAAQDTGALWRSLEGMGAGSRLQLTLKDGAVVEGLLVEARADSVTLDKTRLVDGAVRLPAGSVLGGTITFLRADVVHLQGPKAAKTGSSAGKKLAVAAIVAGVIFLLSPPGRCITSSTGC